MSPTSPDRRRDDASSANTTATPHGRATVFAIPALDGLRAAGAILVVLTHAAYLTGFGVSGGLLGRLFARGDFGVTIFFALSGFLLHRILVDEDSRGDLRVGAYYAKRLARVAPAYWCVLLVVAIAAHPPMRSVVLHALTLEIYVADAWIPAFGQAWSLATEVAFYAVLPLVVLALRPLRRRHQDLPLLALTLAAVILTLTSGIGGGANFGEDVLIERWLSARAPHFLIGMIADEAVLNPRSRSALPLLRLARDPVACVSLAGGAYLLSTTPLAGALTLEPATSGQLVVRTVLSGMVAAGLLLPLVGGRRSAYSDALSLPFARWLGVVSYGIFLWHVPVFAGLYAVSGVPEFGGGIVPLLALGVPITLLLAALSYWLVELPASRLVARLVARRTHRGDESPHQNKADRTLK